MLSSVVAALLVVNWATWGEAVQSSGSELSERSFFNLHFALERRQSEGLPSGDIPARCRDLCTSVRSLIAEGCRPSTCCNQPFIDGYANCYKCVAAEVDLEDHRPAKNVIQNIVNDCEARTGNRLEVPFLPDGGPISAPPLSSTVSRSLSSASRSTTSASRTSSSRRSSSLSTSRPQSSASSTVATPTTQSPQSTIRPTSSSSISTSAASSGAAAEPTEGGSAQLTSLHALSVTLCVIVLFGNALI
ncbi:hypothetical protein BKA70DRAFT_232881 [Coprinopsis sp. MPI-PUGE-AT-0042]|nr:hypothetical protein BKA70DRAFT_232881 [Coprinopsis sp. MPI-PUGE-AT-0042]